MRLSRFVMLCSLLAGWPALAKPWNGITPGLSTLFDVTGKFGDASKTVSANGKKTLVYSGSQAIKGTVQAQFKLDANQTVERIDVYPAVALEASAIEKSYGPACDPTGSNEPCFVRKESASTKHEYYVYAKLGLAVFFKDDGKTVQSLAFIPSVEHAPSP